MLTRMRKNEALQCEIYSFKQTRAWDLPTQQIRWPRGMPDPTPLERPGMGTITCASRGGAHAGQLLPGPPHPLNRGPISPCWRLWLC